jgi:Putative transposase/Transposase zinc-binding domain
MADIVRAHFAKLTSTVRLAPSERRALSCIARCRTAELGGHVTRCRDCGHEEPSYNSCRNRHCPKCQALAQERWIDRRRASMLDVPHFHVVFTLPAELRPLARVAPGPVFDALFQAVRETLAAFAESRLDASVGATLVLHTWTRTLLFHPHIHAIVTGGGLSLDGKSWNSASRRFLFPVKAMSSVFRAKMLTLLRRAHECGHFRHFNDFRDPQGFPRLSSRVAKLDWYIYAKPSFKRGRYVLEYLGRYTHRIGLSNSRLLEVTDDAVTFRTKGKGTETLQPLEFLRRFVQHVLPDGFHKIRHAGLYASPERLDVARALTNSTRLEPRNDTWQDWLLKLSGRDVTRCAACGSTDLEIIPLPDARAPPTRTAA